MRFESAYASDIGQRRKQNQDSGGTYPELGLFVVADGMGGHQGGETASKMAVEHIHRSVKQLLKKDRDKDPKETICEALQSANDAIFRRAHKDRNLEGMGTTATAMLFKNSSVYLGHVGDSRCYFFRRGAIWQVTRDHSLVEEKLRAGIITREQAKTDQFKNVITRSVGFEPVVDVDLYEMPLQTGDVFLICSDGLTGPVDDEEVMEIVQEKLFNGGDLQATVQELIDRANGNGGDDNITALMVQVVTL